MGKIPGTILNEAVNFCFLDSHNVRLVKIKEGQQFKFFSSNAIDVYANKFQPILCQMKKTQFSFLLSGDQIYFDFLSFTAHQKRIGKVEKVTFWANPGTVCIYQVSY